MKRSKHNKNHLSTEWPSWRFVSLSPVVVVVCGLTKKHDCCYSCLFQISGKWKES